MVSEKKYDVDPTESFKKAYTTAAEKVGDLTIPLTEIAKMWYRGNRSMFKLKGKGKYEDLSNKYKTRKIRLIGQVYPINYLSGTLSRAITEPGAYGSFNQIINKQSLLLGVTNDIEYAGSTQFGYKSRPARPFLLTGVEQVATDGQQKAISLYQKILEAYVRQVVQNG